jgi:catechol 2,3-dioxygenase-like lactoylglutathione lyase family enzyme
MADPDGNRVRLVPPGHDGVTQLAIMMAVRSLSEHRRFYGDILGFAERPWSGGAAFRLGDSLLLLEEDRTATVDPPRQALGWRYITLQIADIDTVHHDLRSQGVREGLAPVTLGDVVGGSSIVFIILKLLQKFGFMIFAACGQVSGG